MGPIVSVIEIGRWNEGVPGGPNFRHFPFGRDFDDATGHQGGIIVRRPTVDDGSDGSVRVHDEVMVGSWNTELFGFSRPRHLDDDRSLSVRVLIEAVVEDAAAIGFDDQFLYDEVAKPIEERSLPIIHVDLPEAREVFAAWDLKTDKIAY